MIRFLNFFLIYKWIDLIEIFFFTSTIYFFSLWLKKDQQKNLVPAFYFFCSTIIFSYALDMHNLNNFLIIFMPTILMLFILVHQNTLQKNFIMIKNANLPKIKNNDWFDPFMRHCLSLINQNKQIICAIEGKDNLEELLINQININTQINKEIIDLAINSTIFNQNEIIHINYQGNLIGLNSAWNTKNHTFYVAEDTQDIESWKQDSLLLSSKTDVLIFKICPKKRMVDIIAQGKIIENLAIAAAIKVIQEYINKNLKISKKGKDQNENINKKFTPKQPSI